MSVMKGVRLPGDSTVQHVEIEAPEPEHGQVLLRMKASSICGSDVRAIYREHLGTEPEAYQGVIAGHEPCGQIVAVGPGCRRLHAGDRVVVYHIAGCGQCHECLRGYYISCRSPARAAYGWQRDGGHADYLLAEESTCVRLPQQLTFLDGACVGCGFGTAYEALIRLAVSCAMVCRRSSASRNASASPRVTRSPSSTSTLMTGAVTRDETFTGLRGSTKPVA